jgi:long-chain fatty acid transport protein
MTSLRHRSVLAGLLLAFNAGNLLADELHYNNILIGDRASGLAGAYTAISDDASGLFYNPAGIVFSEDLQLSASANAYHATELVYKDVLNGGDWKRDSENIVPNYFGLTSKLGDGYIGFSYAVTDFEVENQDSRFTTIPGVSLYIVNINNNDKVTKLGPSYALSLNNEWDFGVTLYLHERDRELTNNQFIRLPSNLYEWSNLYFETSESGYEPVFGLMWSPNDSISFGLSMRKTFITSSKTRTQVSCSSDVNNPLLQPSQCIPVGGSPIDPTITTSNDKRKLPLNVRFGVAYFPTPRLLYTADVSFFEEVRSTSFDAEEVINYAFGIEYYLNAEWAIRGGIYTNESNTPEVSSSELNQTDHVDLTGISLSISRFSKTSSITIGLSAASGDGEAQVITGSSQIQDLESTIETLYLSTSYKF